MGKKIESASKAHVPVYSLKDSELKKALAKIPVELQPALLNFVSKHKKQGTWNRLERPFSLFISRLETKNFEGMQRLSSIYPEFKEIISLPASIPPFPFDTGNISLNNIFSEGTQINIPGINNINIPGVNTGQIQDTIDTISSLKDFKFELTKDILFPKEPALGKLIFKNTTIKEWQDGDSWAKPPAGNSFDISAGANINSSLSIEEAQKLQTSEGIAPRDINLSAGAQSRVSYRSPSLDIYLNAKAGAVLKGENAGGAINFIKEYGQLPSQIIGLGNNFKDLLSNANFQLNIGSLTDRVTQIKNLVSSGNYSQETLNSLINQLNQLSGQLQLQVSDINKYLQQANSLLDTAIPIANTLKDGTYKSSLEVAGGACGTLDIVGRIPLGKDTTLSLKGSVIYVPDNPNYNSSDKDSLQPQYMLAAMRMDAGALLKGTEYLKGLLGNLKDFNTQLQNVIGSAANDLNSIQNQIFTGDLNQTMQNLQNIQQIASSLNLDPSQLAQLQQTAASIVSNINNLEKNFEAGLDIKTRMITPTQNLGAGIGAGISQNIRIKDENFLTPENIILTASVDNITGYLAGKDEVRQLNLEKLVKEQKVSFEPVSTTYRNVYKDFFPTTYRGTINLVYPKSGTVLTGGLEKIEGIPNLTTYYGITQKLGKNFHVQAGRLHDGPANADLTLLGIQGGNSNTQFFINFATDNFDFPKAKNISVFGGIKLTW